MSPIHLSKLECILEHQLPQSLTKTASDKRYCAFVCTPPVNRVGDADLDTICYCTDRYESFLVVLDESEDVETMIDNV